MGDPGVQGGEADRGDEQRPAEHRHRRLGGFAAVPEVLGDERRREGDQRDPHQQVEVEQEELAVDHPNLIEETVMVQPDHPDLGEGQQVGEVARPLLPQCAGQCLALVIPDRLRWARPIAVVVTAPGRRWPCGTSRLTRRAGRSWDVRAWSRSPDERRPPTVVWAMASGILTPSTWRGTGASRGKAGFVEQPLE